MVEQRRLHWLGRPSFPACQPEQLAKPGVLPAQPRDLTHQRGRLTGLTWMHRPSIADPGADRPEPASPDTGGADAEGLCPAYVLVRGSLCTIEAGLGLEPS
jgi:hypothetical protein